MLLGMKCTTSLQVARIEHSWKYNLVDAIRVCRSIQEQDVRLCFEECSPLLSLRIEFTDSILI